MSFIDKEKLNVAQKEAVCNTNGPLLILAGAGAGKTKVITYRIANLIQSGVRPSQILAVTFTNKAAKEMRERVLKIINENEEFSSLRGQDDLPFIKTFHSLGVHIIKENHAIVGLPKNFTIFDSSDSRKIISEILKIEGYDLKQYEPKKIQSIISKQKNDMITIDEYQTSSHRKSYIGDIVSKVWSEYENRLKKEGGLDFDDLLLKAFFILKKNESILAKYQERWKFIHIDEYQDTNEVQYKLSKLISARHKNICVVGDIDQNIYSWRGASIKNIMSFEEDYDNVKEIVLEENYRSTQNILEAANNVISKNKNRKDKNLFTNNCEGDKICLYQGIDEYDEAKFIVKKIKALINEGVNTDEVAILYRANFQSRVLEEICLQENVPHQVIGTRFFDRKEIKDVLSYIKAAINELDYTSLSRIINVPKRGIGKVTVLKMVSGKENEINSASLKKVISFKKLLSRIADEAKNKKPHELISFIVKESGLEDFYINLGEEGQERLENINELVALSRKYAIYEPMEAIEKMIEDLSLNSDQDEIKDDKSGVKLMTVHAAKGLEFDYVFITGLEAGLFPHNKMNPSEKVDEEEERRLFYVAITRAKKNLFLSYSSFRTIYGSKEVNIPSEFLGDINDCLLEYQSYSDNFQDDYSSSEKSDNNNYYSDDNERPRREYLIDF